MQKLCTCLSGQRPQLRRAMLVLVNREAAVLPQPSQLGCLRFIYMLCCSSGKPLTIQHSEEQTEVEIQNESGVRKVSSSLVKLEINGLGWISCREVPSKQLSQGCKVTVSVNSRQIQKQLKKHNSDCNSWPALCSHITCNIGTQSHLQAVALWLGKCNIWD